MARESAPGPGRPDQTFVGSLGDLQQEHGSGVERYIGATLGKALGLEHFGVNHETIFPGGRLSQLEKGDAVAFPAGTGIAHSFLNNSDAPVELLIVGEHSADDQLSYPVNPEVRHPRPWKDAPTRPLGPHDGIPEARR